MQLRSFTHDWKAANGQETLTPRDFYKRFHWKNDPGKVVLPE